MRRVLALALALLLPLTGAARAEGVTLWTVSSFAGADAASAMAYVELLKAYEARTGNTVVDNSATSSLSSLRRQSS